MNPYESPKTTPRSVASARVLPTWLLYVALFTGIGIYLPAVPIVGTLQAVILRDVGNVVMLSTAVLTLIQIYSVIRANQLDGQSGADELQVGTLSPKRDD
jgi:hypothetical protein